MSKNASLPFKELLQRWSQDKNVFGIHKIKLHQDQMAFQKKQRYYYKKKQNIDYKIEKPKIEVKNAHSYDRVIFLWH
jgi:hypothetical protein